MQDHALDALGGQRVLKGPSRLAAEQLLLLRLPLDDLEQIRALHRRHLDQLLRQPGMGQHQRHRAAVIIRLLHGLADQPGQIREVFQVGGALPFSLHHAMMHGQGGELLVEPTDT